ncbi:Dpy-30 motif containing protein [Leishmania donovani]|uniref:Dpy-30 motif family protein n=1 Tax=Leishmania donovani TaxID=5661 RepID=A0A504Y4D6_LEIDO|nr:Dpy-30 motif family protein [Leishmania donovani]CAJ1986463.1 Dpy-30 motif containing protein [Leishmania donovani]VDZ42360.1 Dpy-30_motif_containing_protein_putative/Pfam:PF05186 [Leishmania donovani]
MDSAYLKNHVGMLLAKGVAETVTAQPSNPQEYLALFLLHQLQEEERKVDAATRRRKVDDLRQEWCQQRALHEKAAVDVIQRCFHRFQDRLRKKRAAEEELREVYEAAEAEAEELLDEEEAIKAEKGGEDAGEDGAGATSERDSASRAAAAQEKEAVMAEARREFFKAQRFLLTLPKSAVGQLKHELEEEAERVRIAQDATLGAYHRAAAQEAALVEATTAPSMASAAPALSPAAAELAERLTEHRDHRCICVPYVKYLVFRCLCYLLLNATPKATSSAEKVAALLKPSVLVQHLRAFNPVASYDRGVALKLERIVPELADSTGGDEGNDEGDGVGRPKQNGTSAEEEGASVPFMQPTTRQVRRAARVLRTCWLDGEYHCEVDPEEFYTEEMIEEDAARAEADREEGEPRQKLIPTLADEVEAAAKVRERVEELRNVVETQVKQRGGTVMYALLRFVSAAVAYRQARDAVVQQRQEMGLPVDTFDELPEDEAEDPMNDEALIDEETGELDAAGVQVLQERIGVDTEEALAKIWEARDRRQREAYSMKAISLQRQLDASGEEEEDED